MLCHLREALLTTDRAEALYEASLLPYLFLDIADYTTNVPYSSLMKPLTCEVTTLIDPDGGTFSYTYDADQRALTEVSGTRTIGNSYDLAFQCHFDDRIQCAI